MSSTHYALTASFFSPFASGFNDFESYPQALRSCSVSFASFSMHEERGEKAK